MLVAFRQKKKKNSTTTIAHKRGGLGGMEIYANHHHRSRCCVSVGSEWRESDVCRYSLLGSGSRREEWFPGDLLASYSSQITDISLMT